MARAGFIYLQGAEVEQEAALLALLQACWNWLAPAPNANEGELSMTGVVRGILESPDAVQFDWLTGTADVRGWPGGRAFGSMGELSWRREGGLTHAVLVTDRDDLPSMFEEAASGNVGTMWLHAAEDSRLERAQLWGTKQPDGFWREARIPGPLSYPIEPGKAGAAAALLIRRYTDAGQPDTGAADFVRYVDVQ